VEEDLAPDRSPLSEPRTGPGPETLYDERNPFLDFSLGAMAVAERTVTALAAVGEPLAPVVALAPHGDTARGPILR
jgi:hypothetical protein